MILWGLKTEAVFDVWSTEHLIRGIILAGFAFMIIQKWTSQIPPAKPGACFVNRSKRFVEEPPNGGCLCYLSLNISN
jgi:hypothetical protein